MKLVRRTFLTFAVFAFSAALALLLATLALAACSGKVSLRFETFDGTPLDAVEGRAGSDYAPPAEPLKEGYYFDGWYLKEDLSGEKQTLPEKLPEESVTYYAKYARYPVLTLRTEGGTLKETTHLIKPGVPILGYLALYPPQKEGLTIGGWLLNGELLSEEDVMPSGDITLTAKYKAAYSVDVYLQDPDEPSRYVKSEKLSVSGYDWEGETLAPEMPEMEHFLPDVSKNSVQSRILAAGRNVIEFYFTREEMELVFHPNAPAGETKRIETRYGAHVTLPNSPYARGGYEFFGWSEGAAKGADFAAGEEVEIGRNMELYGAWAKLYPSALGGAQLAVGEYEEDGVRRAVYLPEEGARAEGSYFPKENYFAAGDLKGRLDDKGYFLPDDSGVYEGYGLIESGASAEKYGTLTLDFEEGKASYALGGETYTGEYSLEYDEEKGYTGRYLFRGGMRSTEGFRFLLNGEVFLKEGEERGEYALYDCMEDAFTREVSLYLDGFGGAEYLLDGKRTEGVYRGSGLMEGEWLFDGDLSFRFLVGGRRWSQGGGVLCEEYGFMVYDEARAGTFSSPSGTLTLDGYGYSARCLLNGREISGRYILSEGFVTLFGEETVTFTLKGGGFALTGGEAGVYRGERGLLSLDGASGGVLNGAAGTYEPYGDDWLYLPEEGEKFRFRVKEGEYAVYRAELFGTYDSYYGTRLSLDGFGGGTYRTFEGKELPVSVGYYDEDTFELLSPQLNEPLFFRIRAGVAELVQGKEAGVHLLFENGAPTGELLYLDGSGNAKWRKAAGETEKLSYVYLPERGEVSLRGGNGEVRLLLTEKNGEKRCLVKGTAGTYLFEGGSLTLDGYGNARYVFEEELSGDYVFTESGVEMTVEGRLFRFVLSGGRVTSAKEYLRYNGALGELCIGEGEAILRGDREETGALERGEVFRFAGEREFRFRLRGGEYFLYSAEAEGRFRTAAGEELVLDGCGFASYSSGGAAVQGRAEITEEGVILFLGDSLSTYTGTLAFLRGEGDLLLPLGREYGAYRSADGGGTLFLRGDGSALLETERGGTEGSYLPLGGDAFAFTFGEDGFTFRIGKREDGAVWYLFRGELSSLSGSYRAGESVLTVDECRLVLETEGKRVEYLPVCASAEAVVARDPSGKTVCFGLFQGEFILGEAVSRYTLH